MRPFVCIAKSVELDSKNDKMKQKLNKRDIITGTNLFQLQLLTVVKMQPSPILHQPVPTLARIQMPRKTVPQLQLGVPVKMTMFFLAISV